MIKQSIGNRKKYFQGDVDLFNERNSTDLWDELGDRGQLIDLSRNVPDMVAFANDEDGLNYGPAREHNNGIVSDALRDNYIGNKRFAQVMRSMPPPISRPPIITMPSQIPSSSTIIIPAPANDRTPPVPASPIIGPIPKKISPLSPEPDYALDNQTSYNPTLDAFLDPKIDGPLKFVQRLPNGWFLTQDQEIIDRNELDDRWHAYKTGQDATVNERLAPQAVPLQDNEPKNGRRRPTLEECGIRPYKVNALICGPTGRGEAHHGFPDYLFRLQSLARARAGNDERAPGAPTYSNGLSICVPRDAHQLLHSGLNKQIEKGAVNGTTSFDKARALSFSQLDGLNDNVLNKACKQVFKEALDAQYSGIKPKKSTKNLFNLFRSSSLPVRATTSLPSPDAENYLREAWGLRE